VHLELLVATLRSALTASGRRDASPLFLAIARHDALARATIRGDLRPILGAATDRIEVTLDSARDHLIVSGRTQAVAS
jgi:hypothetical protein